MGLEEGAVAVRGRGSGGNPNPLAPTSPSSKPYCPSLQPALPSSLLPGNGEFQVKGALHA